MRESGRCFLRIITDLTFYTIFIRFNRISPPVPRLPLVGCWMMGDTKFSKLEFSRKELLRSIYE